MKRVVQVSSASTCHFSADGTQKTAEVPRVFNVTPHSVVAVKKMCWYLKARLDNPSSISHKAWLNRRWLAGGMYVPAAYD